MKKFKVTLVIILFVLVALSMASGQTQDQTAAKSQAQAPPKEEKAAAKAPRPIELLDILAWKSISSTALSTDGQWFAYRLSPTEGDGEVIIRQTKGTKEYKFPAGESRFGLVSFSEDAKYCAFMVYPNAKEAKALRKEKKPVVTKAALVNLATGDKVEYDKIKSFAFSRENPAWLALLKNPPESQAREKDKWSGSDLVLRELATGKELMFGNVSEFAFDKKGLWLAMAIDAFGLTGNGVELRNMTSGVVMSLDNDKANYKSLTWTEKGDGLACLKGKEDKAFEDKLYSVAGFTGFAAAPGQKAGAAQTPLAPQKVVYDPKDDKTFPQGMTISPNRAPQWSENLDALFFGISEPKKKEEGAKGPEGTPAQPAPPAEAAAPAGSDEDTPDLVLWHWLDKRLQSQQQVQASFDQNFSYLAEYRIKEKKFIRLADDDVRQVQAAPKFRFAVGIDNKAYELDSNLDGRRYQDIYVIDLKTGTRNLALKKNRNYYMASPDGTHFLFYDDGHFYTYDMTMGKSHNITKDVPTSFVNEDDDHNIVKPPDYPIGWAKDGVSVLLSDGWDIWDVPVHGGKGVNLTVNGQKDQIRYRSRFYLDPEEKGIDLAKPLYVTAYGEWTKKAGIIRIEKGKPAPALLLWDDAGFSVLTKAKKTETYVYTRDTYKDYPDYYVADAMLKNGLKLTDANPQQKDFFWSSGSILLDYKSAKGDKLQGALFLPANYEKGKKYPTIVYYYEKTSQGLNRYTQPSVGGGFNKSVYTSNGYAVLMPDIVYKINDPGMSAVWCVLPAIDAAVAAGVIDRNKIGLQGHSWGGYQTAFLVTQADFAAAVAGAPLTNMISMYSSIYFNSGSANQPIFESSQGRFKGGYWDNLEAYQRNSPVYYAEKVKTPLIILHNDKDGAVVWNQGIEYYNTLRRLKKPVIMLQYVGENHGLAKAANQKDYATRMLEFFDHHLKGKPAPKWMEEGIPHLKMKDHLKERVKALKPPEPTEKKENKKESEKK